MCDCIRGSSRWVTAPNAKLYVLPLSVLPKIRNSEMFNPKVNTIQPCIYLIFWLCGTASYLHHKWNLFFPFTLIWISWPFKDQLNKDAYICICTLYATVLRPSCLDHSIALGKWPFRKKLQRCSAWLIRIICGAPCTCHAAYVDAPHQQLHYQTNTFSAREKAAPQK